MKGIPHAIRGDLEIRLFESLRLRFGTDIGDSVNGRQLALQVATQDQYPDKHNSRDDCLGHLLYSSFLRKWKGFKGVDPEKAAFQAWQQAELRCFRTNRRLEIEASTSNYSIAPSIISDAQRKIMLVLGPLDIENISRLCRNGPGATCDLRRGVRPFRKNLRPSVTSDALELALSVYTDGQLDDLYHRSRGFKIVRGNRMVMVPKSVKTHRPIAAEPTANGYIQQGIGRYLRMRLKRFGVDLDDQTINRDHARRALVDRLVTCDLSSASDTLCVNLVKLLLPPEWYALLDAVRSKTTTYRGKVYHLSKFSSMGNAFTFELESLIFSALLSSACANKDAVSVYGDDMVFHQDDTASALNVLDWAGFLVNPSKSFGSGSRFFESCGGQFFDGEEVTPIYQKDVCIKPVDFIRMHNRFVRAECRLNIDFSAETKMIRDFYRQHFPKYRVDVGPVVENDEFFISRVFSFRDQDRVRLRAIVGHNRHRPVRAVGERIYYARKLRTFEFSNSDPKGYVLDPERQVFRLSRRAYWRSSAQAYLELL